MKRINEPLLRKYSPIRVFVDQLEAIEELLLVEKSGYKIVSKSLEFSNVKELCKKYENESITDLKISSSSPYVTLELHKLWTRLYVGSNNNLGAGLFYKLDRIILTTTRKPSFLYSDYTLWVGYIGFFVFRLLLHGVISQIVLYFYCLFLAWTVWVFYIRLFKHSEIVLSKRHDVKGFLKRNGDQIIVNLVTATVSAALGVLGTIFAYKIGYLK
jgi:hypothetical protein